MKKAAFIVLSALVFSSCGSEKKPVEDYGKAFLQVMKNNKGFARGVVLGLNINQVKEAEGSKPKDEDGNYLYYEYYFDTSEFYTVEYNFDERGLYEMRIDAYLIKEADARALYESFKEYYTDAFGKIDDYYGFAAWQVKQDNRNFRVELSDESAEYRQGKFSLLIYYSIENLVPKKKSP